MDSPKFVYVLYVVTTPEKLWQALTTSEFTEQYWGRRRIESDWQVGSPVVQTRPDGAVDFEGKVLEYDPPRRLAYTFLSKSQTGPSRVTFELKPYGPNVILTLTHEDLNRDPAAIAAVSNGWPGILSGLKTLLETGQPMVTPGWNS